MQLITTLQCTAKFLEHEVEVRRSDETQDGRESAACLFSSFEIATSKDVRDVCESRCEPVDELVLGKQTQQLRDGHGDCDTSINCRFILAVQILGQRRQELVHDDLLPVCAGHFLFVRGHCSVVLIVHPGCQPIDKSADQSQDDLLLVRILLELSEVALHDGTVVGPLEVLGQRADGDDRRVRKCATGITFSLVEDELFEQWKEDAADVLGLELRLFCQTA